MRGTSTRETFMQILAAPYNLDNAYGQHFAHFFHVSYNDNKEAILPRLLSDNQSIKAHHPSISATLTFVPSYVRLQSFTFLDLLHN